MAASYLYKTTIFKSTTNVINAPASNAADKTDFENNFKATAIKVTEIEIAETTFVTYDTFAAFKARIVSPLTWADVKYTENGDYNLYLLSDTSL